MWYKKHFTLNTTLQTFSSVELISIISICIKKNIFWCTDYDEDKWGIIITEIVQILGQYCCSNKKNKTDFVFYKKKIKVCSKLFLYPDL